MKDEKKKPEKKSPKHEKLTEREWAELRGEFMPTYKRVHGRIRRR